MPIEFYCSQCRNRLRVADSAAGKEAQCPVCGAIVAVPATGAAGYPPYTPGAVGPKTSASGEGIAPVPPMPPEALARPVPPGNAPGPPPGVGPQPAWYGAQFTPYSATPVTSSEQGRQEGWGVASLILGLFGLLAWCCPLIGIVVGILAIIFGIMAIARGATALGIIGIILGALCLILSIINVIVGMAMMMAEPAFAWCPVVMNTPGCNFVLL